MGVCLSETKPDKPAENKGTESKTASAGSLSQEQIELNKQVDQIFLKHDTDKSNTIEKGELKHILQDALAKSGKPILLSDQDVDAVFNSIDKNKSGSITKAEFTQILRNILSKNKK